LVITGDSWGGGDWARRLNEKYKKIKMTKKKKDLYISTAWQI
jgi:hypothetical protein